MYKSFLCEEHIPLQIDIRCINGFAFREGGDVVLVIIDGRLTSPRHYDIVILK